jgi:hypothetical protein
VLRWALPALVSYSLRWLAVVSHQRQMVLRPLQDQGDVAGMQYPFKIALRSLCSCCRKLQCCSLYPWHLHLDMLNGANQRAFLLPLCPSPTILKSCRPSRALALPPRVSALYAQDLSKAVRAINLHSPGCAYCRFTPYTGEAQSIKPAEGTVEGCIQSHFCLELGRMVAPHAALCLQSRAFCRSMRAGMLIAQQWKARSRQHQPVMAPPPHCREALCIPWLCPCNQAE